MNDNTELVTEIKNSMSVPSREEAWSVDTSPESGFVIVRNTEYDKPEDDRESKHVALIDNNETVTLYCKTVYDGEIYYHVPLKVEPVEEEKYRVTRKLDYNIKSSTESLQNTVEFFCDKIWDELRHGHNHHKYSDDHYLDRREEEEKLLENMI